MRTLEIKAYKLNELSDKAREKAIDDHRDINIHPDWYKSVFDSTNEILKRRGFDYVQIAFEGFYCQGDFASFTAEELDKSVIFAHLNENGKYNALDPYLDNISFGVGKYQSYKDSWYGIVESDFEIDQTEEILDLIEELDTDFKQYHADLCHDIFRSLETEYEYLTSNEQIEETLECNEYEFYENGKMIVEGV